MIAAVVLAAGESRRMGQPKLLLPFGASTIIHHVVTVVSEAGIDDIVVVTGHVVEEVARNLADTRARVVVNEAYHEGMLSSVRAGIRACDSTVDALLVVLGDQPLLRSTWIHALQMSYWKQGGGIHVPTFGGRRGHPLLISASFRKEILSNFDDEGLRGLLRAHPGSVYEVPLMDPDVLVDVDTPEDYERVARARGASTDRA